MHRRQVREVNLGDWTRSYPSQPRAESSCAIAEIRAACSGCPPVSCSSELGCSSSTDAIASTVPLALSQTSDSPQVAVVGAGAAGLYTALCAARAGRDCDAVSGPPLAGSLEVVGPGRARRGDGRRRQPRAAPPDTIAAGRGAVRESAARGLVRRGADAVERPRRALGMRFDADRQGRLSLGLEGGHSVRRDRARRRRSDGSPPGPPARALVAEDRASRCSRAAARPADHRPRRRWRASASTTARRLRPQRCSPPAAPPRCGRARLIRRARSARGCCSPTPRARRSPTSS